MPFQARASGYGVGVGKLTSPSGTTVEVCTIKVVGGCVGVCEPARLAGTGVGGGGVAVGVSDGAAVGVGGTAVAVGDGMFVGVSEGAIVEVGSTVTVTCVGARVTSGVFAGDGGAVVGSTTAGG